MISPRKQSSTSHPVLFFLALSVDHITGATGKTPTITLSKDGAAFGASSGVITELTNGWYSQAGHVTDRSAVGELAYHITATGCDPVDFKIIIQTTDFFDLVQEIWDKATTALTTAGSIGKLVVDRVSQIGSGTMVWPQPVSPDGKTITWTKGDTVTLPWNNIAGFPDFMTATQIKFTVRLPTGTMTPLDAAVVNSTSLQVVIPHTVSLTIPAGTLDFDIQAVYAGAPENSYRTVASGKAKILADVTP